MRPTSGTPCGEETPSPRPARTQRPASQQSELNSSGSEHTLEREVAKQRPTPVRKKPPALFLFAAMVLTPLILEGCASTAAVRVRPWQRAALADDTMNPDRDPTGTAVAEHVYFSREAASGGRGVGGSGCGCN